MSREYGASQIRSMDREKMDGGKHKVERAEEKMVNIKANNRAPSETGGTASAERKRLVLIRD